eukprot:1486542-Rhodomonas_salina.2
MPGTEVAYGTGELRQAQQRIADLEVCARYAATVSARMSSTEIRSGIQFAVLRYRVGTRCPALRYRV